MGRFKYNPGDEVGPHKNILLERSEKKEGTRKWICKFKCALCDNTFQRTIDLVSNGDCYLCEDCQKKKRAERMQKVGSNSYYKDYTEKENPFYEFIEPTERKDKDGSLYWKIKCKKCGTVYEEIPSQLISEIRNRGNNPCSCWRTTLQDSKGNLMIEKIIKENNISFLREFSFEDYINPQTGAKLKFDFFLPDYNCCIEYDGEQHFRDVPTFGTNTLEANQYRDNIKNNYCIENEIILVRVPYYDYQKISYEYLEERGCFGR